MVRSGFDYQMVTKYYIAVFVHFNDHFVEIMQKRRPNIANGCQVPLCSTSPSEPGGWSGGAMVLGKLKVPGCPTIRIIVGQGLTALAVGADGGCLDILFSSLGDGPM